jgi:DNA mismatch repair protein MutS
MTIYEDYIEYNKKYKEKYGLFTVIFIEVGSFYELYSNGKDNIEIYKICEILNIIVSRKNKSISEISDANLLMAGFPNYIIDKYTNILVENNYTVVLVSQITAAPNPKRDVTNIISPSTSILNKSSNSNYMIILYFEQPVKDSETIIVGISGIDLTTGETFIYEVGSTINNPEFYKDECYRIVSNYEPVELILICDENFKEKLKNIKSLFENICKMIHYYENKFENQKKYSNITYQIAILEKVYIKKSLISIIDYLKIDKINIARTSFCILLQFAYEHDSELIKKLFIPTIYNCDKILNIEYNSSLQLNLHSLSENDKSLLKILNRCSTSFGKRAFKERLLNPINNIDILNKRYKDIEKIIKSEKILNLSKTLSNILDLNRILRKIILLKFAPIEWISFHSSLESCKLICLELNLEILTDIIDNIINSYINILNLYEIGKTNIFKREIFIDIDNLEDEKKYSLKKIENINETIYNIDNIIGISKIENNERDGYYLLITKKRYEYLLNKNKNVMNSFDKKLVSASSSSYKLTNSLINELSNSIEHSEKKIIEKVEKNYKLFLEEFILKNYDFILTLIKEITYIDISVCNAKNAIEFSYSKPILENSIDSTIESSFSFKDIRHPIIERIHDNVEYITNDISSKNIRGMLLYGINSSGKSSLLKAVGLNIIMAQAGMFVASKELKLSVFNNIFTRISNSDNIYQGLSSFTSEMKEIRNILNRSNKNSLILGDEVCSSTESISAISIVSSCINYLIENNVKFIFASHLHEIIDLSIIKKHIEKKNIYIGHMNILFDKTKDFENISNEKRNIIFERKLKEGDGSRIYGIEICKFMDMPKKFIEISEIIKKELLGISKKLLEVKKNQYNSKIIIDICEICNNKATEIHHIKYQKTANNEGFIDHYHKNVKFNLVALCEKCHNMEHNGKLNIIGYISTSEGIKLNYIIE